MAEREDNNTEELKNSVLQRTFGKESVMNVKVDVTVILGSSMLRVYQLLKLGRGAVIELNQKTNDPVEIGLHCFCSRKPHRFGRRRILRRL